MSEGYYSKHGYIPWTTELILSEADAEAGPGCCDDSYQKLRAVMVVAPELLTLLERIVESEYEPCSALGDWGSITITLSNLNAAKEIISRAKQGQPS